MLRRNVLILHAGALGDFVLAWPLILALGRLHPQSRIIVVTHASKGVLAEAALRVESADVEHGWHGLFADAGAVPLGERAAAMMHGAHAIYTFLDDDVERVRAHAPPEVQLVALRTVPPDGWTKHASDWLLEQLAPHAAVRAAVQQILRSIATRGIGAGRSHDGDVVVQPGSGSPKKCWPVKRFVELIDKLRRARRDVRVILGEAELERFSKEEIAALEQHATAARRPANYLELFNELRTAAELVANDSGPAHLGAILGVPTLTLFGPTDPAVWKPMGPRVTVLREEPLEKLSVAKVLAAAKALAGGGGG